MSPTAANVDLPTVKKNDDDSPAPRPVHDGDTYVRRRTSARNSARNSKIVAIQHGSHQSIQFPLRPSQTVVRVTSQRVTQTSSPMPIPGVILHTSYTRGDDRPDVRTLHHSVSPPLVVQAPTPPQANSPHASRNMLYHDRPSPRTTQQSFSQASRHSSRSRYSHHSRSGSSGGRHSGPLIVDPPPTAPATEVPISRSRSDAGPRGHSPRPSPADSRYGRGSTPSIQPVIYRERSRERTSNGVSFLDPDIGRIQQGLKRDEQFRIRDGEIKGPFGGGDEGEAMRIVYGRGPRVSAGRLGTHGERNLVFEDGGRRHYGSQ